MMIVWTLEFKRKIVRNNCLCYTVRVVMPIITPSPSLLTFKQLLKCTYFVCAIPVLPFSCCADCKLFFLWSLK